MGLIHRESLHLPDVLLKTLARDRRTLRGIHLQVGISEFFIFIFELLLQIDATRASWEPLGRLVGTFSGPVGAVLATFSGFSGVIWEQFGGILGSRRGSQREGNSDGQK